MDKIKAFFLFIWHDPKVVLALKALGLAVVGAAAAHFGFGVSF